MNSLRGNQVIFLIGRCFVGGMYIWSGSNNLLNLGAAATFAGFKGLPYPQLGVTLASLLIIAGGLSLVTGIRPRLGVAAVTLFLVCVTPIMHNWWALDGTDRAINLAIFADNVALFGSALMFLVAPSPWPFSLENQFNALVASLRAQVLRRRLQPLVPS